MGQLRSQMVLRDRDMVPRILVQAMFVLMLGALALVSFAVLTDRPHVGVPTASPIVTERVLMLEEASRNGPVTVTDEAGETIARSDTDLNGFIGVIHRIMIRERTVAGAPAIAPVRVVRRENGHIAILDTVTPWSMELIGYGHDNVAAFAKLID